MDAKLIKIDSLNFHWKKNSDFQLSVPSLTINEGEKILLLGESGSGKTTLLSLICGFIAPLSGNITLGNTSIDELNAKNRDRFRADNIGIIFQQFNLLPYAKVIDNILLPLYFSKQRSSRLNNPYQTALDLCNSLRLPEQTKNMKASTLSVGQQQRVAVARALIGNPSLIIADEPTSSLDMSARKIFLDLMFSQISENQSTLLMVSHDPSLADHFDRTINIEDIIERSH